MGVIPKEVREKVKNSPYIKSKDFEQGMELEVVGFEIVKAKSAEFGANESNYLVGSGMLKEGDTIKYTFKTVVDKGDMDFPEDKIFESSSVTFFISFSQIDPSAGEIIFIKRTGQGRNTKYEMSVVTK